MEVIVDRKRSAVGFWLELFGFSRKRTKQDVQHRQLYFNSETILRL